MENDKIVILNQKGGFSNKFRIFQNILYLQQNNFKFYILDEGDDEFPEIFFNFIKNVDNIIFNEKGKLMFLKNEAKNLKKSFNIINSLDEIPDIKNNYIYLNEYNFEHYLLKNNYKKFKKKYIYVRLGKVLKQGIPTPRQVDMVKIELENKDLDIQIQLGKYENIVSLRCAPHEFECYSYLSNKLSFIDIEKAIYNTSSWRNFYRIDKNENLLNYLKTLKNSVILLDYCNIDIKNILIKNNLKYLEIYNNTDRNKDGIFEYLKKNIILCNLSNKINIYTSGYCSNKIDNEKKILPKNVLKFINIKIEDLEEEIIKKIIGKSGFIYDKFSSAELISNPKLKYDIYLSKDISKNYDNIFNSIVNFNTMLTNFSYKIALELYFNQDLGINSNIIKLNDEWQQPIATEMYSYLQLKHLNLDKKYIAYPWANVIDNWTHNKNIERGEFPYSSLYEMDFIYLKSLNLSNCFTVIQHIFYKRIIPFFKYLGIKYVFASHCLQEEEISGVKIFPYFLFCFSYNIPPNNLTTKKQNLMCNAIYSINTNKNRNDIIDKLNKSKYINIIKRETWFFNEFVYDLQIRKKKVDTAFLFKEHKEYMKFISNSSFQICLAGSGFNTIRLFESLKLKIVPVVDFNINYNSKIFKFSNYVINLDMNNLTNHLENNDLDTYIIDNKKFIDIVTEKQQNIERDYKKIYNLRLYGEYINEKLN